MLMRNHSAFDRALSEFERALGSAFGAAPEATRVTPAAGIAEGELDDTQRRHAAGLMRVNHTGEICAQALYQGQALTARNAGARAALEQAAAEETDHLAWTAQRINELGGRASFLNPLWYAGSFALGAAAGFLGDKWNLGFLAETERQVEGHLAGHLDRLPPQDEKSRAIVNEMKVEEARHARTAIDHGAAELPEPVKLAMKVGSRIMTRTAYWI